MFLEWIVGVMVRPGATFERAREHMRFDHWWIVLSVVTLNVVVTLYRPAPLGQEPIPTSFAILYVSAFLILLLDLQALLLLSSARVFGWTIRWIEAVRFVGLAWSVHLLEHVLTFPIAVQGNIPLLLWIGVPFFILYMVVLTAGVRRLTGFTTMRSLGLTALATIPWQAGLLWLTLAGGGV